MIMWVMSDRAIPRSFRFMEGFGVHTFRFVERRGRVDVREVPLEADARPAVGRVERGRQDQRRRPRLPPPRPVGRDHSGRLPGVGARRAGVRRRRSPTRSTSTSSTPPRSSPRSWSRCAAIGRLVLDRVVDNFFAETEQVAFCTQNVVPGIDFTNDPLLQGRNFSYLDTQLKRLGSPNFTQLPVNAPRCPVAHFQQDGHMAMPNPAGRVNYEPNSSAATTAARARIPAGGLPSVPGRGGRARSGGSAPETLRRPLQPGPAVLPQPDAGRAAPHRRRLRVRAEQVRAARDPRADGRQPAQRRRGPRHRRRRRARPRRCPTPSRRRRGPDHRPARRRRR